MVIRASLGDEKKRSAKQMLSVSIKRVNKNKNILIMESWLSLISENCEEWRISEVIIHIELSVENRAHTRMAFA